MVSFNRSTTNDNYWFGGTSNFYNSILYSEQFSSSNNVNTNIVFYFIAYNTQMIAKISNYLCYRFISISMGLCACNSAGHLSNHAEVAPNHAGITFSVSNTLVN